MGGFFMLMFGSYEEGHPGLTEIYKTYSLDSAAKEFNGQPDAMVLQNTWNMSVAEIRAKDATIDRSSHGGNIYASNMAAIDAFGPLSRLILFDRNTAEDENYAPWAVRFNMGEHPIAIPNSLKTLAPFFNPNDQFKRFVEEFGEAESPAQLHRRTIKRLLPSTLYYSEWLLQNQEPVTKILDALAKSSTAAIFDRTINAEGATVNSIQKAGFDATEEFFKTADHLDKATSEGKTKPEEGLLIPTNKINVYLFTAMEALDPSNQRTVDGKLWAEVYHAAGPDMTRYVHRYQSDLERMHRAVLADNPDLPLPTHIFLGVIPTHEMKLTLPDSDNDYLTNLTTNAATWFQEQKAEKDFGPDSSPSKRRDATKAKKLARRGLRELITDDRFSQMDLASNFARTSSQYDGLTRGQYRFPKALDTMTFKDIAELNKALYLISQEKN